MKRYTLLYILLLPVLAICQTDSLSFKLTIQNDSTLNFTKENVELYNYLENQIDIRAERGFFPREKVIVRCLMSKNGSLDSIIVVSSFDNLKLEVSNAVNKIDRFELPNKYDKDQMELLLIFERWKEAGEFEITGWIKAGDN